MSESDPVRSAVERSFVACRSRAVAALVRRFGAGRLALAENALQEACVRAIARWSEDGIPERPEGWLLAVAHNAAVDALRRERWESGESGQAEAPSETLGFEVDDELRLMFLCCSPELPVSGRVALALNVAFGLEAGRIARLLLSDERTLAQRIVRAKQRLRALQPNFDIPGRDELGPRLEAMLDVLYLVFTEGHTPSDGDRVSGEALCAETLRLVRLLTTWPDTATPAAEALHSLLCFQASRFVARHADDGSLLLLPEQDRSRWNPMLAQEGFDLLARASRGDQLTRFHVEAAIASCHAAAPSHADTDWPRIVELYDVLRRLSPSPVVDVGRAVAVAMTSGALAGIDELDAIAERDVVQRYPYALAAYADLHASLGNLEQARAYLDRALEQQTSPAQRGLLARKRAALER
jgi:predicted RNA polymerase sigma factor